MTSETDSFALTTEGLFRVVGERTNAESWLSVSEFAHVRASNVRELIGLLQSASNELKEEWNAFYDATPQRKSLGDNPFPDKGGEITLFDDTGGGPRFIKLLERMVFKTGSYFGLNPPKEIPIVFSARPPEQNPDS